MRIPVGLDGQQPPVRIPDANNRYYPHHLPPPKRPMSEPLLIPADGLPEGRSLPPAPAVFAADAAGSTRFWEFFTARHRNANTRRAYLRAAHRFADWCAGRGIEGLEDVAPIVVAAYIEQLTDELAPASVRQHLAALRALYAWLRLDGHVRGNPTAEVRGPRERLQTGKTPALAADEAGALLAHLDREDVICRRDQALLGALLFACARVGAVVGMQVRDYAHQGKRSILRLHEKGGRYHEVPAHHRLQEYLDAYLAAAGIDAEADPDGPLFRACGRSRKVRTVVRRPLTLHTALRVVKRRCRQLGLPAEISPHSFRVTGLTEYLRNGGTIDTAAQIAGHASIGTTTLYDRRRRGVELDEIERILV